MKEDFGCLLTLEETFDQIPDAAAQGLWSGNIDNEVEKEQLQAIARTTPLETVKDVGQLLCGLSSGKRANIDKFWALVAERNVSLRKLVTLLFLLVEDRDSSEMVFTAAKTYIDILQLQGSTSRSIFHAYFFRIILNLLKESDTKHNNDNKKAKHANNEDDETQEDEGTDVLDVLTPSMKNELLKALKTLFSIFPMEAHTEALYHVIEVLAELTRAKGISNGGSTFSAPKNRKKGKKQQAEALSSGLSSDDVYQIMHQLLQSMHGEPSATLTAILKDLLPNFGMKGPGPLAATVPKYLLKVRDDAVKFVKDVVVGSDTPIARFRDSGDNKDQIFSNIHALFHQICSRVADKADYRAETAEVVSEVFFLLPIVQWDKCVGFLSTFSKNKQSNWRQFAVEVAIKLITSKRLLEVTDPKDIIKILTGILVQRSSDKIAIVRAKAISGVATVLQHISEASDFTWATMQSHIYQAFSDNPSAHDVNTVENQGLMQFLKRRAEDEKYNVRRSALLVLETVYRNSKLPPPTLVLEILCARCNDPSPLLRKQAIATLTQLSTYHPEHAELQAAWRCAILPLVMDRETTVQEKCLDAVSSFIMDRVVAEDNQVWPLISQLDSDDCRFMHQVCSLMVKKKVLPDGVVRALVKAIKKSDTTAKGAWILLAELAPCCPGQLDREVVLSTWRKEATKLDSGENHADFAVRVLTVLESVIPSMPGATAKSLAADFFARLKSFSAPPALIQRYLSLLPALAEHSSSHKDWPENLLEDCERVLNAYVGMSSIKQSTQTPSVQHIEQHLFTLGEVVQVLGGRNKVSAKLETVIQALLAPTLVTQTPIPLTIRAHAFVTLGKLCLNDEALSKRCIAIFVRELETSTEPVIRNNVMVIMCDLCVRYTSMVDRYIPNIALCLRDENELVRRQTLMLLTRLLQEDYVKWKGPLFFRFIIALIDPSSHVREFANYCLVNLLLVKQPTMFSANFLEAVFVLNDYRSHSVYNQGMQSERERTLFSLKGDTNHRIALYSIFLKHMTEDQHFQLTAKLCQEVLADFVDGKIPLEGASLDKESAAHGVLLDTLKILGSKEIKVSSKTAEESQEGEEQDGAAAQASAAATAAKGKLLTKLVKKNILEKLKQLLEKHKSSLLKYLMAYLKELLKDYKNELQDIMVGDKLLAKELEYDLRVYEKKNKSVMFTPSPVAHHSRPTISPALQQIFSPKPGKSPKADLGKFSVPRLKKSVPRTPSSTSQPALQRTTSSPFKTPTSVAMRSPYKTPTRAAQTDIVFSPVKSGKKRWSVELDENNDTNNASDIAGFEIKTNKRAKRSTEKLEEETVVKSAKAPKATKTKLKATKTKFADTKAEEPVPTTRTTRSRAKK